MARPPAWTDEEMILALEVAVNRDWHGGNAGMPEFIELSRLLRLANFPKQVPLADNFRSPSSVVMKVSNLIGAHPHIPGGLRKTRSEVQLIERYLEDPEGVLSEARTIRAGLGSVAVELDDELLTVAAEGGASWVLTLKRERSRPLRRAKLSAVESAGGSISCEVCGFDFASAYGEHGRGYVEVHHRTPLHVSGGTESALDDLALLCANCHRMIHRRGWLTVESLAEIVRSRL